MAGSVGQYTQAWFPFVGHKSEVGAATRIHSSSYLAMGALQIPDAQNNEVVFPLYLDSVTWKYAQVFVSDPSFGIVTVLWDGSSKGTIDTYAAVGAANNYAEITGIAITPAKAADLTLRMATKNASSTGYRTQLSSIAWIRTGGTASTPAGTDTPGYTWELPGCWMGSKANTSWNNRSQSSAELSGGRLLTDTTDQNTAVSWDIWKDTGTYKVALVYSTGTDYGIHNITGLSGTQTIDAYAAGPAQNNYSEVTGVAVAAAGVATLQDQMATKNASSTAYRGALNSIKVIRTGA